MWNIKNINKLKKQNKQTKPNKNKHVDTENRVVVTRGKEVGKRAKWVKEIKRVVTDGK